MPLPAAGSRSRPAARHQITLYELVARQASLEEAFMDLTHDAVDYRPHLPHPGTAART
jgi:ABC-2 type transport system ATP-binding protein